MIEETRSHSTPPVENFDLFSMAFSSAAIGMALVATDGRFLNVNEAMCRITGYSRSELLARVIASDLGATTVLKNLLARMKSD